MVLLLPSGEVAPSLAEYQSAWAEYAQPVADSMSATIVVAGPTTTLLLPSGAEWVMDREQMDALRSELDGRDAAEPVSATPESREMSGQMTGQMV